MAKVTREKKSEPRQNSDIDGTLQKNIKASAFPLFQILFAQFLKEKDFGEIESVTPIPDRFPRKKTLDLDSLFEVVSSRTPQFFFNVELQSANDNGFIIRLHEYYSSFLQYLYNRLGADVPIQDYPAFFQVGLYVGDKPLTMSSSFTHMENKFVILLIDIRTLKVEDFLNSRNPHIIVLAILVYTEVDAEVTETIIKKLEELNLERSVLIGFILDIFELSIKRSARGIVKTQIEAMHYEERELILADPFYQQGVSTGLKEGEKKGIFKTALNMWRENEPLEKIKKYTSLSNSDWKEFLALINSKNKSTKV